MTVSFSELRAKEVIRICDAECIGCVADLILDGDGGCIRALCVIPSAGLGALFSGERTVIPWEKICCIGRDTVLVSMTAEECCADRTESRRGAGCRFRRKS